MARSIRTILGVTLFCGAIGANYLLFQAFAEVNYFLWYLSQGSFISLSTAFLSIVVNDLDRDTGLVSAHPGYYWAGCLWVLALVNYSVMTNFHSLLHPVAEGANEDAENSIVGFLWDVFVGLVVTALLVVIVLLWLVVVAPIQYFVFLVAGAPVRMGLLGKGVHAVHTEVHDSERQQTVQVLSESQEPTENALDITFTRKPVTMTSAIAAILLWLANYILALFS